MNVSTVKEWIVLSPIKPKLESNGVSLLYVFGKSGKEVIYVTSDDEVYAFGENRNGCLGLGHKNAVKEPTIVKMLCAKKVKLIQSNNYDGFNYVLAVTKSGQLYSWGWNRYGTLGNGSDNDCYEPNLINALRDANVIDVRCGSHHCLALTESGDAYGWGWNRDGRVGSGGHESVNRFPINLLTLRGVRIASIACGAYYSMAVTESGVAYGWGHNGYGQLGLGNTKHKYIPIKVELSEGIAKVCAGFNHTLLLSTTGEVYACGHNSKGQIGNPIKGNASTPVKIAFATKIADILASNSHNISLALSIDNKCYVCGVNDWTAPTEVLHNNMNEAFNNFLSIRITVKPLTFTTELTPVLNQSLRAMTVSGESTSVLYKRFCDSFNVRKYSDIKFIIEGKHIFAQKLYLKSVCKHFESFFNNNCLERSNYIVDLTEHSYSVYYAFFKYLYTKIVDIKPEEAVELLNLAISYSEEELKNECIEIIRKDISIENVCQVFIASLKHNCEELADYCADFASNNMNQICKTEHFKSMDGESMAQLICKIHK